MSGAERFCPTLMCYPELKPAPGLHGGSLGLAQGKILTVQLTAGKNREQFGHFRPPKHTQEIRSISIETAELSIALLGLGKLSQSWGGFKKCTSK